jgi:hypothetical protein
MNFRRLRSFNNNLLAATEEFGVKGHMSNSYKGVCYTHITITIMPTFEYGAVTKVRLERDSDDDVCCTELLGLFWTLSIVVYVEDKRPQSFGDWICLRPQVDGAG